MAELGKWNRLRIIKDKEQGYYLDGEQLGNILLPHSVAKKRYHLGDAVDVFLYLDSEDRLIATTHKPYAEVEDFALLEVVSVTKIGAFLDWGLPKDLFVPLREQQTPMQQGESYVVFIYIDEQTGRLVASSNLNRFVTEDASDFEEGQAVKMMLCEHTDLGYRAIVDGDCWGLLYENEVFQEVHKGDILDGYIKKIREDGKVDLTLYPAGYGKIKGFSQKILTALQESNGFLPLHDKSSPDDIYAQLQMSKKNFKKAIGGLFKKRLIRISKKGIQLTTSNQSNK